MEAWVLAGIVTALLIAREVQHHFITKDLMNRFMAKDFTQYHIHTRSAKKYIPKKPPMNDEELAKWEKLQDSQVDNLNSELDARLAAVASHKSRAGVGK